MLAGTSYGAPGRHPRAKNWYTTSKLAAMIERRAQEESMDHGDSQPPVDPGMDGEKASLEATLDAPLDSPTIRRLIEEVKTEELIMRSYNRTYNRHNR